MATSILTRSKLNKVFLVVLITAAMTAMAAEALALGNPKPPSMSDALWYSPALL